MRAFLANTPVIDHHHPHVRARADRLSAGAPDPVQVIQRCFEFVRDEIAHCIDAQRGPVVLAASEVLAAGVGYCYAKAHLLAALLRACGQPTALCYQRLTLDGPGTGFCLHGLNAVWLNGAWLRLDPRGNRDDVRARFDPPREHLAFSITHPGERDLPGVYAEPLPQVVAALSDRPAWDDLLASLPDSP